MLISDKHKFIFIHNPKAAGTSVFKALKPYANFMFRHEFRQFNYYSNKLLGNVHFLCNYPMHINASDLRKEIGEKKWNSYLKFGVVRNPYDRATSFFFYLLDRPGNDKYKLFRSLGNFREYIMHLKDQRFKETQKYYFTDESGHILLDKVLRFENLQDEFAGLTSSMGLPPLKLSFSNTRKKKKDFKEHLDNEILQVMNDIYNDDFKLFGYDKIEAL